MKNVNQVIELLNKAIQSNNESKTWFFSYSGHVQLIDVRLYPEGWRSYEQSEEKGEPKIISKSCYLDQPESVQELYYWIKFNLNDQL